MVKQITKHHQSKSVSLYLPSGRHPPSTCAYLIVPLTSLLLLPPLNYCFKSELVLVLTLLNSHPLVV